MSPSPTAMTGIRVQLLLFWVLFIAFATAVLAYPNSVLHPPALLICLLLLWLSRVGLPRPQSKYSIVFGGAYIVFLILVLIHSIHPFSASVVHAGMIIGAILWCLGWAFAIHRDYAMFKRSGYSAVPPTSVTKID